MERGTITRIELGLGPGRKFGLAAIGTREEFIPQEDTSLKVTASDQTEPSDGEVQS